MKAIENLLAHCPEISDSANYWFIRTEGGAFYNAFISSGTVALGYSKIPLENLGHLNPKNPWKHLRDMISRAYPENKRPGLAASQIMRFTNEIKRGDYVFIPSHGTQRICIGRINDDYPHEEPLISGDKVYPEYSKRRKVTWMKKAQRKDLNPTLLGVLHTHQTIADANIYSKWIDMLLFDFYKKGNQYHYILDIEKKGSINARSLFQSLLDILELAEEFAEENSFGEDTSAVQTRVNLNSPGTVELISEASKYIFIASAIVVFLNGGGVKFKTEKLGIDVDLKTDGLIRSITNFLKERSNAKLTQSITSKLDELKVRDSQEMVELLKATSKTRNR